MAIANRLARVIHKCDKHIANTGVSDHGDKIKILMNQLKALGVSIRHKGHEKIVSERKAVVNSSGVILN